MDILKVKGLCKHYPGFDLNNVCFSVEKGRIMGFVGRNGAGKTTTLKSLMNYVHPDSGEVLFFGKSFDGGETEIKQRTGFVSGGVDYYPHKRLATITDVTRRFYDQWDGDAYLRYRERFCLDEKKTPDELSAGMKVKYALALALSHRAELLILDEPTSGLVPVSREDLLDEFLRLRDEGISILFSTHITSDLDKCADDVTYIQKGRITASADVRTFTGGYRTVEFTETELTDELRSRLIGIRRSRDGLSALVRTEDADTLGLPVKAADLESIMVHLEKEDDHV